jgi:hypothetical protein
MIASIEIPTPFPVFPLLISSLIWLMGIVALLSSFRPAMQRTVRVPLRIMDTGLGRVCIACWCFAMGAIEFARAFRWSAVTSVEVWFYVVGFGSLILALVYGLVLSRFSR